VDIFAILGPHSLPPREPIDMPLHSANANQCNESPYTAVCHFTSILPEKYTGLLVVPIELIQQFWQH